MSAKIKYTNEPLGDVKVIKDFLPSPAELSFNEEAVKVTLALSKKSIDFFKSEATKNHTPVSYTHLTLPTILRV